MGDRVGVELLYNWVELGAKAVASRIPDSQRPDVVVKATPDRGGPRKNPDGVEPKTSGWASKRTRKTQRDGHNSGVKIWSLCSVSSTLSHANLEQPFQTLQIKWEVNIFEKKSSCVFLPAFFFLLASLLLCRCELFYIYMCMYVDVNLHMWLYNNRGVMVKAMDCGIVVNGFVLQSCYYVHFRANTLGKGMNPLILPALG